MKLHSIGEKIWEIERDRDIDVGVQWVPHKDNVEANAASREIDYDDWRISKKNFNILCQRWEIPSIDMFANDRSAKCRIFFSDTLCPDAAGIDAFNQQRAWENEFLWLVPPVSLMLKTSKWAAHFQSAGIVGFPLWESQPFFPLLKPRENQWADFVIDGVLFPIGTKLFENPTLSGVFESEFTKSPFVFLLIDFKPSMRERKALPS